MPRSDRYSNRPNSSSRWGFMKRMTLRRADGKAYLDRLRIVQTPWFGIYLHRMEATDPGRDLHDHPWPFATFVLRGGYHEWRAPIRTAGLLADCAELYPKTAKPGHVETRVPGRPRRMRLDEAHTIFELLRVPTWTLVFVGRRVRNWGFYVPATAGVGHYVHHDLYPSLGRRDLIVQEDGNAEHFG